MRRRATEAKRFRQASALLSNAAQDRLDLNFASKESITVTWRCVVCGDLCSGRHRVHSEVFALVEGGLG